MIYPKLQEQTLYSAITFRRLLMSLACPGEINQLAYPQFVVSVPSSGSRKDIGSPRRSFGKVYTPNPNESSGNALGEPPCYPVRGAAPVAANLYALGALLTLLDREVTFAIATDGQWLAHADALVQWLILRSGSALASPESAIFAFFCQGGSGGLITQLNRGTLLEPESSATAFYCVDRLTEWATGLEEDSAWITLELTGPGIESIQRVHVAGLDRSEIMHMTITRQSYPLGVDVYLVDSLGYCIGIPRTTRIHLLGKESQDGVCLG
jgi:alpha-D-ribose 1-methylphosphonate 5-triphosphate synthase subunit PhnH